MVQGVMTTTAKNSANIEEFQEAFSGRIASLAKVAKEEGEEAAELNEEAQSDGA